MEKTFQIAWAAARPGNRKSAKGCVKSQRAAMSWCTMNHGVPYVNWLSPVAAVAIAVDDVLLLLPMQMLTLSPPRPAMIDSKICCAKVRNFCIESRSSIGSPLQETPQWAQVPKDLDRNYKEPPQKMGSGT